MEGGSRGLI